MTEITQEPTPRAYSYVRFSSPSQAEGDSFTRQTKKAVEYAAEHGLTLDTELNLTDLGVSGYRGKNAEKGALGVFLKAVDDGMVSKGSYLLIENADRLSRDAIYNSMPLFFSLINAGVVVVTLTNRERYSQERLTRDPMCVFGIVLELIRANQESFLKGQRVAEAKERKRALLAAGGLSGKPYTRQTPAWITWSDETHTYHLVPERTAVIREIFGLADKGWHVDRIARELNKRDVPTWGGHGRRKSEHWRGSYLRKIFDSKAALGFFTPTKTTRDEVTRARRDVPLDAVRLWPASVDEDLYWRVASRFQTTAPRGKNASRETLSLVAGVAKCTCGSSIIRMSKGPSKGKNYVYLVCSRAHAKAKGCEYLPVRYEDVENRLRELAKWIRQEAPRGKSTAKLAKDIQNLEGYTDALESDAELLAELAAREKTPVATRAFRDKERELQQHLKELRELRARQETLTPSSVRMRLKALEEALTKEPFNVAEANRVLRQTVKKITLDPKGARLELHWHHDDEDTTEVAFYSRHMIIFDEAPDLTDEGARGGGPEELGEGH